MVTPRAATAAILSTMMLVNDSTTPDADEMKLPKEEEKSFAFCKCLEHESCL
jgi:hypothetical protein